MSPAEWQAVKQLFDASLETLPELRAKLLAEADVPEVIRAEAARLLANHQLAGESFLNAPGAVQRLAEEQKAPVPSLSAGERLGPYEIVSLIGIGGMGEVYKAQDTRLGRTVAIKVSKAEFSERFEREARAVAALNHPNICQLYDVGPNYLVMEFIEGAPIQPTSEITILLDRAIQIADGMTAAHAIGIKHRDLKPANILVTREGRVKILDFGIAQMGESGAPLTVPGTILGTQAYMSPEQAHGQKVDARSDLWSLGVILYEMATGKTSLDETETDPEQTYQRNTKLPATLEPIIARLLDRNRETRYQSSAAVCADLKRAQRHSSVYGVVAAVAALLPKSRGLRYGFPVIALLLIGGGMRWWLTPAPQKDQGIPAQVATKRSEMPVVDTPRPEPPRQTTLLTDQDVLVMADFTNSTEDTAFDGALRQALAFELEQSPFLKIMDDEAAHEALKLMGRPAEQPMTNDIAHEVCVREGQKATISGSIASLGTSFQIALQAVNCQTGATLARERAEAADKEHVLTALTKAATGIRAKLGESLSSIEKTSRPSWETTTTPSLEAFRAYRLAADLIMTRNAFREAVPHLQRAIELDPNFAAGYERLANTYVNLNDAAHAREYFTKAFALIDHVSERERMVISGGYYQFVTRDLDKAIESFQVSTRIDPLNPRPHNRLGNLYVEKGDHEKALREYLEANRLAPRNVGYPMTLLDEYARLDRFDEAKALSQREVVRDQARVHVTLLRVAFIQNDLSAQEKEIRWFAGKPEELQSVNLQAVNAYARGQRRQGMELFRRVVEMLQRQGNPNPPPPNFAEFDAQMGDCESVRKANQYSVFCADASALQMAQDNAAKSPAPNPNGVAQLYLRGFIAMTEGKGAEAAAEFQKVVDHKEGNWGATYAQAYLFLARAEAIASDTAKAKRAYQDFLTLWKDADEDLPFYIQAKREFAELR
jgi:eukaryotic-like serine/threonine-protein kinase